MHAFEDKPLNSNLESGQDRQDANLIALVSRADEKAFEQLYHRLYSRLFRFIARITRRTDIIDEIINDVMLVVWERADSFNGQCKVSTWVLGIAYNKARETLRNNHYFEDESLDDQKKDLHLMARDNLLSEFETIDWLEVALDKLSTDQRAVIEMTFYHGLHYSEIAELMNCPENTVKTRMHHARKKLADFLLKGL